ncbi:MAG: hypothetical protein Q8O82_07305 [Pseudorhodobacter sp.]|nr:hypothetical protein [Pseudorhodobacter sp.]
MKTKALTAARLKDHPHPILRAGLGKPAGRGGCVVDPPQPRPRMKDVEPILGNIDTDKDFLHHVPTPVLRGLCHQPQSTVQDNDDEADGSQATGRGQTPGPLRDAVRSPAYRIPRRQDCFQP